MCSIISIWDSAGPFFNKITVSISNETRNIEEQPNKCIEGQSKCNRHDKLYSRYSITQRSYKSSQKKSAELVHISNKNLRIFKSYGQSDYYSEYALVSRNLKQTKKIYRIYL